jgi:hypothetical protein
MFFPKCLIQVKRLKVPCEHGVGCAVVDLETRLQDWPGRGVSVRRRNCAEAQAQGRFGQLSSFMRARGGVERAGIQKRRATDSVVNAIFFEL